MRFPILPVGPTAEIETTLLTTAAAEQSGPLGVGTAGPSRRATFFSWGWD
jgi:hypothetical protein